MPRISKPSDAIVVVLAVACVALTSQQSGAQGPGAGPSMKPSVLRAIPAETTAAKAKDPNWKAPRTSWGHPDLEGTWTSDDMRGIPTSRPAAQGERESLTPEEFARRAGGDEASRDRAVNQETILRNEFGVRTFGYTSFIVDPPNGQMPALTQAASARSAESVPTRSKLPRPGRRDCRSRPGRPGWRSTRARRSKAVSLCVRSGSSEMFVERPRFVVPM